MATSSSDFASAMRSTKLLSFDIYGTLIDWETGICENLSPLLTHLPPSHAQHANNASSADQNTFLLNQYITIDHDVQHANPTMAYPTVLATVYTRLARDVLQVSFSPSDAEKFGASIGSWPAFPDTVDAMRRLGTRYKLVALSNIDHGSFTRTCAAALKDVHFDAAYIAGDIGSYKPDSRNFEHLIEHAQSELQVEKDAIMPVAVALRHDHEPSKNIGLRPGVWIKRNSDTNAVGGNLEEMGDRVTLLATFVTLGEFADAVDQALGQ